MTHKFCVMCSCYYPVMFAFDWYTGVFLCDLVCPYSTLEKLLQTLIVLLCLQVYLSEGVKDCFGFKTILVHTNTIDIWKCFVFYYFCGNDLSSCVFNAVNLRLRVVWMIDRSVNECLSVFLNTYVEFKLCLVFAVWVFYLVCKLKCFSNFMSFLI